MIDFSVNVTPLGIPDNIKKEMEEGLERAGWYPDDSKFNLKHAISEKYHIYRIGYVWETELPM